MAKDFTDAEMAEMDAELRRTRVFPADTIFDPTAEARGEPRWRKLTATDIKADAKGGEDAPPPKDEKK